MGKIYFHETKKIKNYKIWPIGLKLGILQLMQVGKYFENIINFRFAD